MKKLKSCYSILFVISFTILLTNSCKKEELNLAPCSVILYQPSNAATELTLNESISWHKVTDPEGDVISYDVYLGTDTDPELVSKKQNGTSFKTTLPLTSDTTYYWKVAAKDNKGGISESDVWSFSTHNVPPSDFLLLSPENGESEVSTLAIVLTWQESVDYEGGLITYDVYLRHEDSFSFAVISSDQDSTSFYFTSSLPNFTTYYWKVVAKDPDENTTASTIWSFTTSLF